MGHRQFRIFLASPSADTLEARAAAAAAVREVNTALQGVELVLHRWDDPDPARRAVMSATQNGQVDVIEQIAHPKDCELVIGLFCHTMGSTLDDQRQFGQSPSQRPWHCTEWEVSQGLLGHEAGTVKDVWVWRDAQSLLIDPWLTPARQGDIAHDSLRVAQFIGTLKGRPNFFTDPADLANQLRPMLRNWVHRQLGAAQGAGTSARATPPELLTGPQQTLLDTLQRSPIDGPSTDPPPLDQIKAVLTEPVQGLRGYLLRRYAQWCTSAGGLLDRRFVNLLLMVDRGLEFDGDRFAPDVRNGQQGRFDDLAELLAQHADVGAWVLVGEPGSGKSTVLQHHELSTAWQALRAMAMAEGAPSRPEVCIWHRLSEYSADSPAPAQWLAERWAVQQPALPALAELQGRVKLRFLLDGLNEIKAPTSDAQHQAVNRWWEWAAHQAGQGPAPVFSVRTLQQSLMASGGPQVRQITLALWTPEQMEEYCSDVLGAHNTLWPAIRNDAEQLSLCRLPFNLAHQCELFKQLQRPARNRAELLSGLFWLKVRAELGRGTLLAPGLLGTDDLSRLAGSRWKQAMLALPQQGCLVRWLDATAERMHRGGREVSIARTELLSRALALRDATPPGSPPGADPMAWLLAVQALGLLGEGDPDPYTGEPQLRFTHQLWQEFFAGRGLRGMPSWPVADRPDFHPPPLAPLDTVLAQLGKQQPLPGPDPSHWEEAVKLAVQLEREPAPWVAMLQAENLALAGRAAAPILAALATTAPGRQALANLRTALLARSRDPGTDLRLRIEAAEALGPLGDPRYEEGTGPQGHRYLLPRREHWVRVPAGRYLIGSEAGLQPNEQPPTPVDLDAFDMAFAPVTHAEYRCFIEAGGYDDEQWWLGPTAQTWRRQGLRNTAELDRWRTQMKALREDFDAAITEYFPHATEAYVEGDLRTYAGWTEGEADAALERTFGATVHRMPGFWQDARFNQPLQPVVGLCWYEACAYGVWLARQTGRSIRLPTEAEWEAAARGHDRRIWPWGDAAPERGWINADPAHLRRTSPVAVFPQSDTPEGLCDLSGNVWEWTSSLYTGRLTLEALTTRGTDDSARRAVRGGSWNDHTDDCRAGCRDWGAPGGRNDDLGFRLVCCPIQEP